MVMYCPWFGQSIRSKPRISLVPPIPVLLLSWPLFFSLKIAAPPTPITSSLPGYPPRPVSSRRRLV